MKRILIATDGSLSAHEAVEFGLDLAVAHDAAVTFLYVVPVLEPGAPAFAIPPVLHHLCPSGSPMSPTGHEISTVMRPAMRRPESTCINFQ